MRADSVAVAPSQRGENRGRSVDAGEEVDHRDADLLRLALRLAGYVHQAAHPLDDVVVAGPLGVGAVLTEAGDRAIDEARIGHTQAAGVKAELVEAADLEILDQ